MGIAFQRVILFLSVFVFRQVSTLPLQTKPRSKIMMREDLMSLHAWNNDDFQYQPASQMPTQTETQIFKSNFTTVENSKIVVFGATGLIGRLVVKQLVSIPSLDATIVAFVRDEAKAKAIFFEELAFQEDRLRGPKLEILSGDLVPIDDRPSLDDLPGEFEDGIMNNTARESSLALETKLKIALKNCNTIINCLGGTPRQTNFLTDFWPSRFIKRDVSSWCRDPTHPYYTHYITTRKVVQFAEREQIRRNVEEEERLRGSLHAQIGSLKMRPKANSQKARLRFIRVSDLCVSKKPWSFVPVVTNLFQSMVFRYVEMAEKLLADSKLLDTVILRPGDLTDEERNPNLTFLQVDESGVLDYPAVVSRQDVASLAVTCAMIQPRPERLQETVVAKQSPFHMTLAVRWVGQSRLYDAPNGSKFQGKRDAISCMKQVLKRQKDMAKGLQFVKENKKQALKPYGVFVALPVYLFAIAFVGRIWSWHWWVASWLRALVRGSNLF